jgi:hypothetical protein
MQRGPVPLGLALFALLVAPVAEGSTAAAEAPGDAPAAQDPSTHVQVILVGPRAQLPEFSGLVEEWLTANGISHAIRSASTLALEDIKQARGSGPPVSIWVAVSSPQMMQIYLAEPDEGRYLVRNVPLPNGLDELGRERAAQVVLSSALAFMERRATSSLDDVEQALRAQAGTPTPTKPERPLRAGDHSAENRPPSRPVAFGYGIGVSYALSYPTEPVHGPGVLLFTAWSGSLWSARLLFRGQYHWQRTIETRRIRVFERGAALSLSGALLKKLAPAWQAVLEMGAGLDSVLLMPEPLSGSDVEPRGPGRDTRPFVTGRLGAAWRTEQLEIDLLLGCDAYTLATRYLVHDEGSTAREFTRARLQPGLLLDVAWGNGLPR